MKQSVQVEQSDTELNNRQKMKSPTFDDIYNEIGEFGLYQILVVLSTGFVFFFGSFVTLNFIFGVDVPDHRCWIPECEQANTSDFNTNWLNIAIPFHNDRPRKCLRYQFIRSTGESNSDTCNAGNFNQSNMIQCTSFIVKDNEHRLVSHLNLLCTDQSSKLALIGTASTLGRFIAMPISGLLSDRFGRLIIIVWCMILGTIFSALQALPAAFMTFELYWVLELLASLSTTGMIGAGLIYNMEWVTAKYRVRMNAIILFMDIVMMYAGIGLAAWYFADNFIAYKLALALPGLIIIFLYFILEESPQWLLTQNKYNRIIKSITKAAKINRKPVTATTLRHIEILSVLSSAEIAADDRSMKLTLIDLLKQKTMAFRLLVASLVWLCGFFAYYGVLLGSAKVHSNKYFSFLLIGLADVLGAILNAFLMDRIGRRLSIGGALPVYAILLLASVQLSPDQEIIKLILFVISKTAIAEALIGLYLYTTEFWPTSVRNTAYNMTTTVGRFGSILASLSVFLSEYYVHLPMFLYASSAIIGSILLFAFLPETMNCDKLPDTIEEALVIGRRRQKQCNNYK